MTEPLEAVQAKAEHAGLGNVRTKRADLEVIGGTGIPDGSQDLSLMKNVLFQSEKKEAILAEAVRILKPGGTLTVIEGDHGSAYFHPDSEFARRAVQGLVELQRRAGGDALIGRRLYPLLVRAGVRDVRVSPPMVYADASRPALVDGFIRKAFTAMVEGVGTQAVGHGLIEADAWRRGIRDLYRTAEADGTFCYTFFKAVGVR